MQVGAREQRWKLVHFDCVWGTKVGAGVCEWGPGNISGGGGGLGLCGDDGGCEHYLKGLYDNNE